MPPLVLTPHRLSDLRPHCASFSVTVPLRCVSTRQISMRSFTRFCGAGAATAVLLLAALCASLALVSAQWPAVNVSYVSYDALIAQLQSVPYDPVAHATTAASLRLIAPMYAFANLALNSSIGAPPNARFTQQNRDVRALVEEFANAPSFPNDFAMGDAVGNIFLPLNDAHTQYVRSTAAYAFLRPFRVSSRAVALPGGAFQQAAYIREIPLYNEIYASVYGASPLANATLVSSGAVTPLVSVDGWQIVSIDGEEAVRHLWHIALDQGDFSVSLSKDAHTRFNLLTQGFSTLQDGPPGAYTYRTLRRYGIPRNSNCTITVRDPKNPVKIYNVSITIINFIHTHAHAHTHAER